MKFSKDVTSWNFDSQSQFRDDQDLDSVLNCIDDYHSPPNFSHGATAKYTERMSAEEICEVA